MTSQIRFAVCAAVLTAVLIASADAGAVSPVAQNQAARKKALVVWGGWPGHQPKETVDIFTPWLTTQGFDVEVSNTLDSYADAGKMTGLAVIVQSVTMGQITAPQERGLLAAVRGGTGFAGWHGGMSDAFRASPAYELLVGGSFAAHPGGTVEYSVRIVKRDDPITKGLADFRMRSEQYYMLVDPRIEVLATTAFSGQAMPEAKGVVMPVAWKTLYGAGRVFHSTLGHSAADFNVPEAREIMKRGILWAARVAGAGDDPKTGNPYGSGR